MKIIKMKEERTKNEKRYYLLIQRKGKRRMTVEFFYGNLKELYQKAAELQKKGYLFI